MRSTTTPPPTPPLQRDPPAFSGEGLRLSEEADPESISAAAALRGPLAVRGVDTGVEMSASLDSGNLMSGRGARSFVAELSGERNSGEIIAELLSFLSPLFCVESCHSGRGGKSILHLSRILVKVLIGLFYSSKSSIYIYNTDNFVKTGSRPKDNSGYNKTGLGPLFAVRGCGAR